jgi:hypothetical protein
MAKAKRRKLRLSWFLVKPSIDFDDVEAIVEPPPKGTLHGFRVPVLRTYPCRAVAVRAACARLKAIKPLASCRKARWFSSFFDQRTRIARLRLSQE